jgi:carbohydrate binding protein with CBM6 domain
VWLTARLGNGITACIVAADGTVKRYVEDGDPHASLTTGTTTNPTTQQLSLPVTGSWDTWSTVTANVTLPAGLDLVKLAVGPNDSGSVNIDSLTIG